MINFYYGTLIPGTDAGEGVYFIKQKNNRHTIYIKRENQAAELYGETNDIYLECDVENYIEVDVKIADKRRISEKQRKFIFSASEVLRLLQVLPLSTFVFSMKMLCLSTHRHQVNFLSRCSE